jgi:hypothetical protein
MREFGLNHNVGPTFNVAQSSQSHYHKMIKNNNNQVPAAQSSVATMAQERMNFGQNSNLVGRAGTHMEINQTNAKQIR